MSYGMHTLASEELGRRAPRQVSWEEYQRRAPAYMYGTPKLKCFKKVGDCM